MRALLFDIGGTTTRVGLSTDGRRIKRFVTYPTPKNFHEGLRRLQETAGALSKNRPTVVCGGIAGTLNPEKTMLLAAPNLRAWVKKPLRQELAKLFHVPVSLENDAALGGLGEAIYGAGRRHHILAYLTVGTGVGGARIVNGTIDANARGFEPGHAIMSFGRRARTLESLISGQALAKRWRRSPRLLRAKNIWHTASHTLGLGLVNVSVLWSPDIIVLGGSLALRLDIPTARHTLRQAMVGRGRAPIVVRGTLGHTAGLYGGLALIGRNRKP